MTVPERMVRKSWNLKTVSAVTAVIEKVVVANGTKEELSEMLI